MKWLLWREYRLNRLILVSGAVILLLPYLAVLGIWLWMLAYIHITAGRSLPFPEPHGIMPRLLFGAAAYSLALSQLTLALLGGNAMAGERADRSAEFMAYLPVSRSKRVAAKLILAGCAAVAIWGFSFAMASLILGASSDLRTRAFDRHAIEAAVVFATYAAITGATFFGVGWLISSFQSSPTFAACGGLITPFLVVAGLQAVALLCEPRFNGPIVGGGYAIICLLLTWFGLSAGTAYFIRRVEP